MPSASQAIDLGLPSGTLWAPWNVGAAKATDAGAVFAWGETTVKGVYNWSTYKHVLANQSSKDCISKYTVADGNLQSSWYSGDAFCGDGIGALGIADDAATANWGIDWRTPTIEQLEELVDNCFMTWMPKSEAFPVNGYLLTSKINGISIFLPASGLEHNKVDTHFALGCEGDYWSSNIDLGCSYRARVLRILSDKVSFGNLDRSNGRSVSPVLVRFANSATM